MNPKIQKFQSQEEASDMNAVDGGGGASEGSVGSIFGGFFASIFESANKGSGDDEDTADVMFSSDSLVRRGARRF